MTAILLVNLGSPKSTSVKDVRTYLNEFLMDSYVLDVPYLMRRMIVSLFILPRRPKNSAEAYRQIFTDRGSPLVFLSHDFQEELNRHTKQKVYLAMRYSIPSIAEVLQKVKKDGVTELQVIPMYPHYAISSYETARARVTELASEVGLNTDFLEPFYANRLYIKNLAKSIKPYLKESDHLLFSYHGIPERHISKLDNTQDCGFSTDCCEQAFKNNAPRLSNCYRAQVVATTWLCAKELNLEDSQYSYSFQSRLGRTPWLQPYTDQVILDMPPKGIKNLTIVCPSFMIDCLETLEEIGIRAREDFLEAGGESLNLVPCLNTDKAWVKDFEKILREN